MNIETSSIIVWDHLEKCDATGWIKCNVTWEVINILNVGNNDLPNIISFDIDWLYI